MVHETYAAWRSGRDVLEVEPALLEVAFVLEVA